MEPLRISNPTMFLKTKFVQKRTGTGVAPALRVGKTRMEGSNNCVCRCTLRPSVKADDIDERGEYALRTPLIDSDTRKLSFAREEARFSLMAAYADVGPRVYDIWYCETSSKQQNKGLHVVMDFLAMDFHEALFHETEWVMEHKTAIVDRIEGCVMKLAQMGVFTYDIKSSNIVLDKEPLDLRFIDFSSTYTELRDGTSRDDGVYSMLASKVRNNPKMIDTAIAVATMVILSANLTMEIFERRKSDNTLPAERERLQIMRERMRALRRSTPAYVVHLVKCILRDEDVKECVEHYMGRRNAGTRRVFEYAYFTR